MAVAGRPRSFDSDLALEMAMRVFWSEGYGGATLTHLTEAMKINRRSLYAAFGNKEELFRKVVERYVEGPGAYVAAALKQPTARKATQALLHGAVAAHSMPGYPAGCLLVQSALAAGPEDQSVRRELADRREATVVQLALRFDRAQREGDLAPTVDVHQFGRYIVTVSQGLAVQAAGGVPRTDLLRIADQTLSMWPTA